MTPEKRKEYEDFFDKYFSELKYDHALIYKYANMNAEEMEIHKNYTKVLFDSHKEMVEKLEADLMQQVAGGRGYTFIIG